MEIEIIDSTLEEIQEVGEQVVRDTAPATHCVLLLLLLLLPDCRR
jgi:hypothetical protein